MDSVRFGRALGTGARLAAKTLVSAVDAAAAPNPSATAPSRTSGIGPDGSASAAQPRRPAAVTATQTAVRAASETLGEVRSATAGVARGSRRFGEAVWGPFARLSGVLWLELTGVFFGLFALSAGVGAWKLRDNLIGTATNAAAHTRLELAAGIALVFTYFSFSSFVRARRRERRP